MEAKVQGYPIPAITWMKDGKKWKGGEVSKLAEADGSVRMSIASADPSDAGEYTAIARNHMGEAKTTAKLDVRPRKSDGPPTAPVVLTPPRDVNVDEGAPIKLTAVMGGNPIPDVAWNRNGRTILSPSTATRLYAESGKGQQEERRRRIRNRIVQRKRSRLGQSQSGRQEDFLRSVVHTEILRPPTVARLRRQIPGQNRLSAGHSTTKKLSSRTSTKSNATATFAFCSSATVRRNGPAATPASSPIQKVILYQSKYLNNRIE